MHRARFLPCERLPRTTARGWRQGQVLARGEVVLLSGQNEPDAKPCVVLREPVTRLPLIFRLSSGSYHPLEEWFPAGSWHGH